jgi:uncharacterized protein YjbI with pentapeptide repeats
MRRTAFLYILSCLLAAEVVHAGERDIAQWIIRQGGKVMLDGGEPIADLMDLPDGAFRITGADLYGTPTVPKDLERLAALTELRDLFVSSKTYNPSSGTKGALADESFQYLAKLPKLERFHVSLHFLPHVDISDAGWTHMAQQTQLKDLRLALTRITKPEVLAPFVNLHSLDLSQAYISDDVLSALAGMTGLKRLNLAGTLVTEAGLRHIRNLTGIEELDLTGVRMTDAGLEYLRGMKGLRKLSLQGADITDEGVPILLGFRDLRELNLYRTKITNTGLDRLRQLPSLAVLDLR